jgi:hypothetical protein
MAAANQSAAASVASQMRALVDNYPRLERLQLATIGNIGGLLSEEGGQLFSWQLVKRGNAKKPDEWRKVPLGKADPNLYTGKARVAVEEAIASKEPIRVQGDKLAGIGDTLTGLALQNYLSSTDRSPIETELGRQAESELMLGRQLTAEQERAAQQSARAAFSARGLGNSTGSVAAEILSRDAMASQREAERRNFAGATNQMLFQNEMARRDQAAQQAALGSTVTGNAANLYGQAAGIGFQGAQSLLQVDPKMRSLNPAIAMGGGIANTLSGMITPTYQGAMGLAGNVASFEANRLDSRYNSYMNNQASLQASRMGMLGSAIQGGIQAGGLIGAAKMAPMMFSDKRMKKDIKPLGKAGSVLGLTTYEYKYKGDDKKRVGFMAQDVQKVLPEAVTEVEYKGKKRLAIRPAVIGAALAEELMAAKAA